MFLSYNTFLKSLSDSVQKFGLIQRQKSGYVLNFQLHVYTDSESTTREKGLEHRFVMNLMESYQGKGQCVILSPMVRLSKSNRKGYGSDSKPNSETNSVSGTCTLCFITSKDKKLQLYCGVTVKMFLP